MTTGARLCGSIGLAAILVFGTASLAAGAGPTAITFTIGHADCAGAGANDFALSLNGHVIATAPTTVGCSCAGQPLVVTVTDPAALALYDPAACNAFGVEVSNAGEDVSLAFVRVDVAGVPAGQVCLFDGYPG